MTEENIEGTQEMNSEEKDDSEKVEPRIFSQEEFDRIFEKRWAKKMASLEKELGVPIKEAKRYISEYMNIKDASKTEMEKLMEQYKKIEEEKKRLEDQLNTYQVEKMKRDIAAEMGLGDEWIPDIKGNTEDEIRESINDIKKRHKLDGIGIPTPKGGVQPSKNLFNELFIKQLRGGR